MSESLVYSARPFSPTPPRPPKNSWQLGLGIRKKGKSHMWTLYHITPHPSTTETEVISTTLLGKIHHKNQFMVYLSINQSISHFVWDLQGLRPVHIRRQPLLLIIINHTEPSISLSVPLTASILNK